MAREMAELGKSFNPIGAERRHDASAWSPIRERLFRSLWIASLVSYTGTWMQNVGAGWLMTSLTMSPLMVSLVTAASSLPVFLVILPAGALADILDRRRLLLITQSWMVVAAAALGMLTLLRMVTPWALLGFTFLLGIGAVMNDPAWQAITPEVVSAERFHAAVALNSAGFNVARAIGPAIGGLLIAIANTGIVFLLNAASFLGVIAFLYRWKRPPHSRPVSGNRVMPAIKIGLQYLRQKPEVQAVLVRTAMFSFSASALLALLPIVARPFGSVGYGAMLGVFGLGALAGAALLPACRSRLAVNVVVVWASILYAVAIYFCGNLQALWPLLLALLAAGVGWIIVVASLNVSAQTTSPAWVRARMLSMYLLVLQGGMAAGSATWGLVATRFGVGTAMLAAAIALVVGLPAARRFRLETRAIDVTTALEA
jgi:MFS family permease